MLISHTHKFIYTKTFKTAGTSVESYFERYCMPENEWSPIHYRNMHVSDSGIIGQRGDCANAQEWWNHMSAAYIRDKNTLTRKIWDEYFKFCVIRNPYDKAISAFFHFKADKRDGIAELNGNDQERFEQWLEITGPPIDRQCYTIDNIVCMDFFIYYENLHNDLNTVCNKLGVPWKPEELQTYKSGFKPHTVAAADFYTPKARKLVEDFYAFELSYFKYNFPQ